MRDATESGTVSSEQRDGMFSVLIPFRLPERRTDQRRDPARASRRPDRRGRPAVAVQRDPHDDRPHRHAVRPLPGHATHLVRRRERELLARDEGPRRAGSPASSQPTFRWNCASPGLREEADARRKAEERATAAEERLTVIQDQYRKTLEELHVTQRMLQERPATPTRPDPEVEARLSKAEGQARLLEGQLKAMSTERDKLARHIAEQAKARSRRRPTGRSRADRKTRQVEQEAIGLRAELEGAQTELSLTRRELDALKARGRTRPGDARGPGRRARRGAPRSGGRGVRAERARPCDHRAGRRPQRAPGAADRGAEGQRLRRGAPSRTRRARQPEGFAPRRPGRARGRPGGPCPRGPRGVPVAARARRRRRPSASSPSARRRSTKEAAPPWPSCVAMPPSTRPSCSERRRA